ncbi:hypothetical protein ACLBOM_37465 [Escherichia coli]
MVSVLYGGLDYGGRSRNSGLKTGDVALTMLKDSKSYGEKAGR